ncbi:alpha/beta fold hydrolase [Kribbella speibonae]|uniref:Alpha/beta hydrolase n=1 Tax=Kribbella speibonae TaxID=1572660 RepID=A0A4R0J5Z0_9ACTN|nr:alpha/beta hydrolase [Kribbella speibonae]TCC18018.1 alpha/beta hydrolase [Kribbella speibonae]TCC42033.1 alpha/beta hydrolase [Kribbella speibonae]
MPEAYDAAREVIADLHRVVTPNGVQENFQLSAGGVDHWVYARGQDRANPVILFVHGGPASPLAPTSWQFQRPIEEYFTVVTYDQRGAGRTLRTIDPEAIADTLTIAQYVADAIELAEQIRERYGVPKLILIGHSWGTIIATQAALDRPDLFHAYVGVGQVIDARANERLCFEYALDQAREHNHTEALEQLASIAPYPGDEPVTRERIIVARQWAQYRGGLSAYRDDSKYFFGAPELSPEYTVEETETIGEGNEFTLGRVLDEMLAVDYTGVTEFPIPVLMFLGRHDYTTPAQPPAEWIAAVEAPYKQAVWFEHSAHLAPWEEPGRFLVSLLTYVRPLAD